jgi:hypothetical protein
MKITWKPFLKEIPMVTPKSYGFKVSHEGLTLIMWISNDPNDKEYIDVDMHNRCAEIPDDVYNKKFKELFFS